MKNGLAALADIGTIFIFNDPDGVGIQRTNFFMTEHARAGLVFCSVSGKAFRLLVPAALSPDVREMITGSYCVVTRGLHSSIGRDMWEFMFEDGSDSPFCIVIEQAAMLGFCPDVRADNWRYDLSLSIWLESSDIERPYLVGSMPARFRCGPLPCLLPWPVGGRNDGAENGF